MKLLSPDEFNKLKLPLDLPNNILEACRYIFILNMPFKKAIVLSEVDHPQDLVELSKVIDMIQAQVAN